MIGMGNIVIMRKSLDKLLVLKQKHPEAFCDGALYQRMRSLVDLNSYYAKARRELHDLFDETECLGQLPLVVGTHLKEGRAKACAVCG
jgi:hypothetical protein